MWKLGVQPWRIFWRSMWLCSSHDWYQRRITINQWRLKQGTNANFYTNGLDADTEIRNRDNVYSRFRMIVKIQWNVLHLEILYLERHTMRHHSSRVGVKAITYHRMQISQKKEDDPEVHPSIWWKTAWCDMKESTEYAEERLLSRLLQEELRNYKVNDAFYKQEPRPGKVGSG
jgi:hypothetical protein